MSGRHGVRPYLETGFASRERTRAIFVPQTPRRNQLLAALPQEDYERLRPDLEPVPLPLGWTVYGAGDRNAYLYFLTAGIVSRFYLTANGASTDFAVAGSEGVIGVASFLGGEYMPSHAVVLSAGYAYRLGADLLRNEVEHDGPLRDLLLRYTQALIAQTAQIAVCNRHHSLEQQMCRWILSCLDRLPSNELTVTQEKIANMLGVRRESITATAGKLQEAGLIHRCPRWSRRIGCRKRPQPSASTGAARHLKGACPRRPWPPAPRIVSSGLKVMSTPICSVIYGT